MNLKEGTRRLALVIGVLGVILGGYVSFLEILEVRSKLDRHHNFERLVALDPVQHICKDHKEDKQTGDWEVVSVEPNCCGIKKIVFDNEHVWKDTSGIYSIETQDGQTLYPSPAPSIWEYFLIVLAPAIGFLLPWGTIRAVGWVGVGFVQMQK